MKDEGGKMNDSGTKGDGRSERAALTSPAIPDFILHPSSFPRVGLAAAVALTLAGAAWPLHPLVTRNARASAPVPAGCEESLASPAAPRVNVAEIPRREIVPVSFPAPPSGTLRGTLDAAQRALVRNDRPAFDEQRAARSIVATYPMGGERSRAEEVLWALDDAAVLWDAQFESPFFDETSNAYARASRYAGYTDAVRRGVLTDDRDRRFYPASESRDFVTRVAAERLQRLGVRSSVPPARTARVEGPSVSATPSSSVSSGPRTTTTRRASSAPAPKRTARTPRRPASTTARSNKPAAPAIASSSLPVPPNVASAQPAEPAPAAPPLSAPRTTIDTPASPAAEVAPPPAAGTDFVTPSGTDTATTTAAPADSEPASRAVPEQAERRSVIVPALLILIGLGVLVVLFRASK